MKTVIISIIAIALVLAVNSGVRKYLEENAPEAAKKERVEVLPVVEVATVREEGFEFPLMSEGVVMTRRETILSAQVGGRIVEVDPKYEVGATFKEGEVIARIDPLDYQTAVAQAKSAVANAELTVEQEEARAAQAARDWKKIGDGKTPSEMVLRVPFLKSAVAQVEAAKASLVKAVEDLDRTVIRAPFDCRVRRVTLNLGATVAPGSQLGTIFDYKRLMTRLPFSLDDYSQIPESPGVVLFTTIGGKRYEWKGEVMWELGEIDQATVSAYLLTGIHTNEEAALRFQLPTPGQFLKARVTGATLSGVVAVPRLALRGRDQVGVLTPEGRLEFRTLTIARSDEEVIYVSDGVEDGEKVILTKLEMPVEGMELAEAADAKSAKKTE